jgi:molybdenum cofactor cytidylyltransferase
MTPSGNPASRVCAIILAAGASSRMGRPKLDLEVDGAPMLRRVVDAALASRCDDVVVVLGTYADRYASLLDDLPVVLVANPNPAEGMGSSIRCGMRAVPPDTDLVVILLGDQPRVPPAVIDRVIELSRQRDGLAVASAYRGVIGPPAVFPSTMFDDLRALAGDRGARSVLEAHRPNLVTTPLDDDVALDIDTPSDLSRSSS